MCNRKKPLFFGLVLLVLASSCTVAGPSPTAIRPSIEPSPTPFPATRTPTPPGTEPTGAVVSPSPRPTPSAIPATPTRTGEIVMPAEAQTVKAWPLLPADLYFIRAGQLWRRPGAGMETELISTALDPAVEQVTDYRLTPDGRFIAYLTGAGNLRVLDRDLGTTIAIAAPPPFVPDPEARWYGKNFDLSADGRYLVYLVADQPAQDRAVATTIYAVEVDRPGTPWPVGRCEPGQQGNLFTTCKGFVLAPDGRRVAWGDVHGVWVADLQGGEPRLLAEQAAEDNGLCCIYDPVEWLPDNRWLLLHAGAWEGDMSALLDTVGGDLHRLSNYCYVYCHWESTAGPDGVWLSYISSFVYVGRITPGETLTATQYLSETTAIGLIPVDLQPLPDGRVAFANWACSGNPGPAVMAVDAEGHIQKIAPLPGLPCYDDWMLFTETHHGRLVWGADGAVFLFLDEGGNALVVGLTDGSGLWDMRAWLGEGNHFTWGSR